MLVLADRIARDGYGPDEYYDAIGVGPDEARVAQARAMMAAGIRKVMRGTR